MSAVWHIEGFGRLVCGVSLCIKFDCDSSLNVFKHVTNDAAVTGYWLNSVIHGVNVI